MALLKSAAHHMALFFVLVTVCACNGKGARDTVVAISGPTMGTRYTVKLAKLPPGVSGEQLHAEIDRQLEAVNDQMSTYRPNSELSRFNRYTGTDWFDVSPETALVVAEAMRVSQLSGGAFDVTVGPLVNLWNFGPETADAGIPSDDDVADAARKVGFRKIAVRHEPPALRKQLGDMYVDLSAIAKGFGVDRIAELLDSHGVTGYLVEIGGEVRSKGTKADRRGWKVGIETPLVGRRRIQKAVVLGDRAMATSGDYRNFHQIDGKRYSHTIDPRTGRPIEHRLASVSVIADNCMSADAMATALMVLGPDEGYHLAVNTNLAVFMIVRGEDGFIEKATPAFERLFGQKARPDMRVFLASLAVFAVAVLGMAAGVIFSNRRLRGTCGGLAGLRDPQGRPLCDGCTTPSESCSRADMNQPANEPNPSQDTALSD